MSDTEALRGMCWAIAQTEAEKVAIELLVSELNAVAEAHKGKPRATLASINSGLLRQALGRMV